MFASVGNGGYIETTDVYRVTDCSDLEASLRGAAFRLCAPSVTIQKLVDQNPDPAVDDLQPGQGWEMEAGVSPTPPSWTLPAGATGDQHRQRPPRGRRRHRRPGARVRPRHR